MQTLINELIAGTVEYKEGGEIIKHPPTALALKAARAITKLMQILESADRINETNLRMVHTQEIEIEQLKSRLQADLVMPSDKETNGANKNTFGDGADLNSGNSGNAVEDTQNRSTQ